MERTVSFSRFLLVAVALILSHACAAANAGTRAAERRRAAYAFNPRIVGGNTARNGRYPYAQISLATSAGLHQCGGTLISPDVILTAGHCHGFFEQIRVNIYNIKNQFESFQMFRAERMHFHPNFDELWFRYDFLLLKLNGTVQGVDPVQLNSDDTIPSVGDSLTVVGWGLTDPDDTTAYPDTLKEVDVSYITNDRCEGTTSKGQRLYQGYIFNDMLCAMEDGKDACSGDSGAPLIRRGSTPDQDLVVGVVSWGNGCATDYPGVYSRLSYQYEWIKDLVCAISKAPPAYFECNDHTTVDGTAAPQLIAPLTAPSPIISALRPPSPAPTVAPEGYLPVKVEIQLDLRSKDTGWSLQTSEGDKIAEVEPGEYTTPYELVEKLVYLPKSTQFVFVMKDTEGDGICCEFGGGWYQVGVVLSDGSIKPLVKGYGTFSLSSTNVFMTPADNYPLLSLGVTPGGVALPPLNGVQPNNSTPVQLPLADQSSAASSRWSILTALALSAALYAMIQ